MQRQIITMAKKKAMMAPTSMKTKFWGRFDFCMKCAAAVGGTVAIGVTKEVGAVRGCLDVAPVALAGNESVADAVFAADEADVGGSDKGGNERVSAAKTLRRRNRKTSILDEHGDRMMKEFSVLYRLLPR